MSPRQCCLTVWVSLTEPTTSTSVTTVPKHTDLLQLTLCGWRCGPSGEELYLLPPSGDFRLQVRATSPFPRCLTPVSLLTPPLCEGMVAQNLSWPCILVQRGSSEVRIVGPWLYSVAWRSCGVTLNNLSVVIVTFHGPTANPLSK